MNDRARRLGIPFLAAAAIVAPLAYYPSYLQIGNHGVSGFVHQWLSLGVWPAGPAWFVWLLLSFGLIAGCLYLARPKWAEAAGCFFAHIANKPVSFLAFLIGTSAAVYVPVAMKVSPLAWSQFGPFAFQTSRLLHYLVYFLMGISLGAYGIERGILASGGKLARGWLLWTIAAILVFLATGALVLSVITTAKAALPLWQATMDLVFTFTCATTSMAVLAVFVRFAKKSRRFFDSLRDNVYGIYLVHYAFVSWLQYAILKLQLSGFAKLSVVLPLALALSWITTVALRRIPAVARVI